MEVSVWRCIATMLTNSYRICSSNVFKHDNGSQLHQRSLALPTTATSMAGQRFVHPLNL